MFSPDLAEIVWYVSLFFYIIDSSFALSKSLD